MTTTNVEKAFAVVEAIWTLENALWELFYTEFLTLCEKKVEEHSCNKTE